MRLASPVWIAAAGAAFAALAFVRLPAFYDSFLYLLALWIVLATSWNILSGYSGYISFGHGAFYGAGMYATATLAGAHGVPFLLSLPLAGLAAAALGAAVGAVAFRLRRLRGELFALLTLAVTFVLATIVLNTPLDGGQGVYLNSVTLPNLTPSPSASFYLLMALAAVVTVLLAWWVRASKLGLGLFAIHDDEDAAEVLGVPTFRYKLAAFALGCALAGVAGGIHALFISYITVGETFSILVPLSVVLMSVLGGSRHWLGPAIGAVFITALLYAFTAGDYPVLGRAAVGLILIPVILFLPEGVLGRLGRRRAALRPAEERAAGPHPARASGSDSGSPICAIRGLAKSFSGLRALDGVDLDLRRGEILALVGPNGSGKSTLINLISGHYRMDAGSVLFDGREIAGLDAHRIAHSGIARTYQIPRPFAHMSVLENVALPARFGHSALGSADAEREAWHWLDFAGLAAKANALPGELTLHERKFLELARALVSRPSLIFLDEVLSGLAPAEIEQAVATIRRIRELGATIVFVEHVMHAVMQVADRIAVLNHGQLIAEGDPREVMRRPEVVAAYLGRADA